jgi:hypothetical protein
MSLEAPGTPTEVGQATAPTLRRALIGLAALGTGGAALELLLLRHWDNGLELIPWFSLAVLGLAIVLVVYLPRRGTVRLARLIATLVAISGAIGVFVHIRSNYESAPLDVRYTDSWPTTPEVIRCLLAATDTVGLSPTLAPAAITFVALALLAAPLHHPALAAREVSLRRTRRLS